MGSSARRRRAKGWWNYSVMEDLGPDVEFFGVKVPPKTSVTIGRPLQEGDKAIIAVHLTQIALGEDPDGGR